MEAAFGTETEINLEKMEICSSCEGTKCEPGSHPDTCWQCNGTGQVSKSQGFFTVRTTCYQCNGNGQTISHPCKDCKGTGQIRVSKKVTVKIPAGVDTGSRLRLNGEGETGTYGGPPGDLYVFIHVEPHNFFERDNADIICQVNISFVQAALGDTIAIPTLNGNKQLKIPKGTQPGDLFRFRGEGIPSLRSGKRGDEIIQVLMKTPTHLNKKQEALLKDFAKIERNKIPNKLKNILKSGFDKVSN
jgi:molecular chaperone DnaJ